MGNCRLAGIVAVLLAWSASASAQSVVTGTQYTLFWRGDLRIIATRPNTEVTIIDANTGAPLALPFTANLPGNRLDLRNAGDSLEANNGTATYRIRIVTATSRGQAEDKPVIVWTGSLASTLKHPAAPPTTTNAWMSIIPALAPGSVENGSEIGRQHWGFVTEELYLFARVGAQPTSILIEDLATNVETDTDDTQTITRASPSLIHGDSEIEVYWVRGFEDDTIRITSNTDVSVWSGIGSTVGNDWTVTPPSWGAAEDFRELGTLFYAFVPRDLTIFPTQDDTTVVITDLTDGDDSMTVTLAEGDITGDYDIFMADTISRSGSGVRPRAALPAVRLNTLGTAGPFDNDVVKVTADKPVLLYVGPKAADTFEYADVAYTIQTGPSSFLLYCYAQNGGADDFQLFSQSPTTNVTITSLTVTQGFGGSTAHDFRIPSPTPYLGGNATSGDWYWSSGAWNGEILRVEADGPLSVISGDYDGPNYGCFIPFVAQSGLLRPIADAGPDISICPGGGSVILDGVASFDADTTPGVRSPTWTWDTDPLVDANGDGDFTNDPDLSGPVVNFTPTGTGPWTITLTYTDDDGQSDTDVVVVSAGDTTRPVVDCPVTVTVPADATGTAFADVRASALDDCPDPVRIVNDRTPNGDDASDVYPCGETLVTFTATDAQGNEATCLTRVVVTDSVPPDVSCPALVEAVADGSGLALVDLRADASDPCSAPNLVNDRTSGGADASDAYPCGETLVTFTATDLGGNVATCVSRVLVRDGAAPVLDCPGRIDAIPQTPLGATVPVQATASDACDPSPGVTNDRTPNGRDATDAYPCGETLVTFTATDAEGNDTSCATLVSVQPPGRPNGISPALRVKKAAGRDPFTSAHLTWFAAADPQDWEHYEIRRTTTCETRPYPVLASDPSMRAKEFVDDAVPGPLWFYQVHVRDCAGRLAPDPMELSP